MGKALAALERNLPDKNQQLTIADHEHVVLIIGWAHAITTKDLIEAMAELDFDRFPNIDKVYFEAAAERIDLVFDRTSKRV
jgi:hypothetical protein